MTVVSIIALVAGAASAAMFASIISGALISLLLVYLAPLPLMVAAIAWGPLSAAIGGVGASVVLGAIFGLPYGLAYAISVALPAWWLGHLALLGRPLAGAPPQGGAAPDELEWYPVGRILFWIVGFATLTTFAALLTLGTDATTITATLRRFLQRVLVRSEVVGSGEIDQWLDLLVIMAFAGAAIFSTMTLTLNLWLAAKVAATSGRLRRPWPDLRNAALPPMTLVLLCAGAAFCFGGGLVAIFAQIVTAALMMAYAFTGFAVLHTLTLQLNSRLFWLCSAYAIVLTFEWPVIAVALLGMADAAAAATRGLTFQPNRHFKGVTKMEVILLERVAKLGQMGEVVKVRDGFARNFLLKRKKALRATAENRAKFDGMKAELEANNLQAKSEASKAAEKIDGLAIVIIRQASEGGQLFGSVSVRDIVGALAAQNVTVDRPQVWLDAPIKTIGQQKVTIAVHPEVEAIINVTVARSTDEAERIKRGEDISTRQEDQDAAAEAIAAAGEFFDPEAQHDDVQPAPAAEPEAGEKK